MTKAPPARNPDGLPKIEAYCPPQYRSAAAQLMPLLYADLRRIAHRERGRISAQTLTTTSLVHDAFLRLSEVEGFESHASFLRISAVTMRHLLIDRVREQLAIKRGGGLQRVELEEADQFHVEDDEWVLSVHEALLRMATFAPRLAEIVECRFFAGYSEKETAQALDVSERTIQRDWALARAWLQRELGNDAARIG